MNAIISISQFSLITLVSLLLLSCGESESTTTVAEPNPNPFPSTYQTKPHQPWVITSATILTGAGEQMENASLLVQDGKIQAIGNDIQIPKNALTIDANGKWVTPGLIDVHSHMGVYAAPATANHADGNELTSPNTAEVWAEHSIWTQDPQFEKSLAGGVTTLQILPGSANLFGGRGVVVKNVPSLTVQGMKYPGAPYSLKMACGENPKRFYGQQGKAPSTRMGNMAGYRTGWIEAQDYQRKWEDYLTKVENGDTKAQPPKRDLKLETLVGVLRGEILVHNHCYRADEMAQMIDLAKEFGYRITAFHHAVEAYKLSPHLARENICAVVWADWWGFKQEAFDMVRQNLALVDHAQACAVIHSDDPLGVQRLNQEIAKAMTAGNKLGLNIDRAHAITWATINAAKALGLEKEIGSLEVGKNADVVLWDADPFSVYAHAESVWIDGVKQFERGVPSSRPTSDFNVGLSLQKGE